MRGKKIDLFDENFLRDNDVMAFGDVAYKIEKVRNVFKDLLILTYRDFAVYVTNQGGSRLGLSNTNGSMPDIYADDYCLFEYLKLGNLHWTVAKIKIYISIFLYTDQADLSEDLSIGCYHPQISFNDGDVISLREDCFCKFEPIKNIFKAIASSGSFGGRIAQELSKSIGELKSSDLFVKGKSCEILKLGASNWESFTLGTQFTIDVVEESPIVDVSTFVSGQVSPLDEIRNISF